MDTEVKTQKWTKGPWTLCHHLESVASDQSCPCGYRGSIWGSDQEHVVCEMGVYVVPGEEGLQPNRYDRPTEIANALLISKAPEMADLLREAKRLFDLIGTLTGDDDLTIVEHWRERYAALLSTLEKI